MIDQGYMVKLSQREVQAVARASFLIEQYAANGVELKALKLLKADCLAADDMQRREDTCGALEAALDGHDIRNGEDEAADALDALPQPSALGAPLNTYGKDERRVPAPGLYQDGGADTRL